MEKDKGSIFSYKKRDSHLPKKKEEALNDLEEIPFPHPNRPRALKQTHMMRALGFGLQTCFVLWLFRSAFISSAAEGRPFSTRLQHREWRLSHWHCCVLISSVWWQLAQRRGEEAGRSKVVASQTIILATHTQMHTLRSRLMQTHFHSHRNIQ